MGLHRVFPACAGMFRTQWFVSFLKRSFPRVRGDVPASALLRSSDRVFSPRARGCSPRRPKPNGKNKCFPRVRGDVPTFASTTIAPMMFSPRARGCSGSEAGTAMRSAVFPACAGMFLVSVVMGGCFSCFPRVRGDVPSTAACSGDRWWFSPRARGCSAGQVIRSLENVVFPACAGMFLFREAKVSGIECFPRVRGDVPSPQMLPPASWWFSPRARGCSFNTLNGGGENSVFPACAGMFRSARLNPPPPWCFPRVRGDVPHQIPLRPRFPVFSPRARGCSFLVIHHNAGVAVFPACAGMFRSTASTFVLSAGFPRVRGDVPSDGTMRYSNVEFSPRARGCSF